MYRKERKVKHRHWPEILLALALIGIIAVLAIASFTRHFLKENTTLTQAKPTIRSVSADDTKLQHIVKPTFQIDLPATWAPITNTNQAYDKYTWKGTIGDDKSRWIDIYIDSFPINIAVNRLLPVQGAGNRVGLLGEVSDNCVNFTDKSTVNPITGVAPAKWNGVDFLCDVGNYLRDVVAVGSTDGINTVKVTGAKTGIHKVMFLYTDDSSNPDYTIFTAAVKSFLAN